MPTRKGVVVHICGEGGNAVKDRISVALKGAKDASDYLVIKKGLLHLSEPTDRRGTRLPIDTFLRSLATDLGQNAIAVILSGTGSDGSAAIREIKEQGGIVLVQDPAEAA